MSADRNGPNEFARLHETCWRQAAQIRSLEDTISVLRTGANALALDNLELQIEIECLNAPALILARPPTIRGPETSTE